MAERVIQYHSDLGVITLIDPQLTFPWMFFADGEINCCFLKENDKNMNDIRIWINKHCIETVYISRSTWQSNAVTFAFTSPDEAIMFATAFGDRVESYG